MNRRRGPVIHNRIPRRVVASAAVLLYGLLVVGCAGGSGPVTTTVATVATTTTTTTTSTVPPTTPYQPTAPQASQDAASARLVAAWKAGDRAAAATDAAPAAVAAVFAQPYPAGGVQWRGCASAVAGPSSCVYRILANNSLLSMSAVPVAGGWFISEARFET